ncbi:MAG: maleylpyruvate isomerase family mycothiol-dependent enzyme [Nocardioidaceae bacterium]
MNALRDQVNVWRSAAADFGALVHELDDSVWSLPTDCPTWSVGDLVAHAAAIESELAGDEPLRVTIDKQAEHIKNGAGIYTERGVAARRGRKREDVVAEYDDAIRRRAAQLDAEPLDDPTGKPPRTPGGVEWDWEALMSRRALDLWIHEQDIRRAVGKPGARHRRRHPHAGHLRVSAAVRRRQAMRRGAGNHGGG